MGDVMEILQPKTLPRRDHEHAVPLVPEAPLPCLRAHVIIKLARRGCEHQTLANSVRAPKLVVSVHACLATNAMPTKRGQARAIRAVQGWSGERTLLGSRAR